jgi:hypothetical protein
LILQTQGHLASAHDLQQRVLETQCRVLGDEHPQTVMSLNNLALTVHSQGDLQGARVLAERAFALSRRRLGEEHPDTLVSAWNLYQTLVKLEDQAAARALLATSALGRLPTLSDTSLPPDLRGKKAEIAAACDTLGLRTPPPGA